MLDEQKTEKRKEIQLVVAYCLSQKNDIMLADTRGKRPYNGNDIGMLFRYLYINEERKEKSLRATISRVLRISRHLHCFVAEFRVMHVDLEKKEDILVKVYGEVWLEFVKGLVEDIQWECQHNHGLELVFKVVLGSPFVLYETYE
jgi:hypothetical protein